MLFPSPLWGEGRVRGGCSRHPSFSLSHLWERGRGEGLLLPRNRKFQSSFVRLPAPELLLFCLSTHAQERARTAKPARRVEGRMPGVKEK